MADIYFGNGGTPGGAGTEGDPLDTFANALAASTSVDDRLIMISGTTEEAPANYHQFATTGSNARTAKAQGFRDATLQANDSHTVRVLYVSSGIGVTDEAVIEGLVLDCEGNVDSGVDLSATDTTPPSHIRASNLLVLEAEEEAIKFPNNRATDIEVFNCKVEKLVTPASDTAFTPLQLGGYQLGANGIQRVRIQDFEMDIKIGDFNYNGIRVETRQTANLVTANINRLCGRVVNDTYTRNLAALAVVGINDAIIANCDLYVEGRGTGVYEAWGIRAYGYSAGVPSADNVVTGNKVDFNARGGYAIEFGDSTAVSNMTGGQFSGNYARGRYWSDAAPHGLALGEDTAAAMFGNISEDFFISFLISKNLSADIFGNIAVNPYGSAFYAKGCKGGAQTTVIRNNVVVLRDSALQRSRGLMEATFQGTSGVDDCAGADFEDNLIIVQSIDALGATGVLPGGRTDNGRATGHLASKIDGNQTANWRRNVYVLPDTTDLSAELFNAEQEGIGVGYCDLDTWNAQAYVEDERIILLPQAQVDALIAYYEQQAANARGDGTGGSLGLIRPLVFL